MALSGLLALCLGYQLGPAVVTPVRGRTAATIVMDEYRLNNYILPGPMKPLGNQVHCQPPSRDHMPRF